MVGLLYGCNDGMNTTALAVGVPLMNVVLVGLRFYARRRQAVRLGADDWFALAALVLLLGMGADLLIASVRQVLSCPQPENEALILAQLGPLVSRAAWAFQLLGVLGVGSVKVSFLYCMRRVFSTGERGTFFSKVTYVVLGATLAWTVGFFVTMVVINVNWGAPDQGDPAQWGNSPATHTTTTMFYAMTVSDVIIDGIIMILPILVVWRLNLSLGRKFSISGIFLLRILALIASVLRMAYTLKFTRWMDDLIEVDPELSDPNHLLVGENLNALMIWWTMFEVGFGLFASCITTIQFLLRRQHVDHFNDKIRRLLGLPPIDRREIFTPPTGLEPGMDCYGRHARHARRGSKHGILYPGDDCSVLSAEYTVGATRTAPEVELSKLSDEAVVETRQIFGRRSSESTQSFPPGQLRYSVSGVETARARHEFCAG